MWEIILLFASAGFGMGVALLIFAGCWNLAEKIFD